MSNTPYNLPINPVVLCILDGWGISNQTENNAILQASTHFWTKAINQYPHCQIHTSGLDVGLPEGQMGNSEVGHMNIGAGSIIMQDLPRINAAITSGEIHDNEQLANFIQYLQQNNKACHLMGLLSDGGVHSHIDHILAMIKILHDKQINTYLHIILDGRDTMPGSAINFANQLETFISNSPYITIATVCGRYYAMDRDHRWDRTTLAYNAMVEARSEQKAKSLTLAIQQSYNAGITDEFILPTVIEGYNGMLAHDGLFMVNFRADRVRQILLMILEQNFTAIKRDRFIPLKALAMTEYSGLLNELMDVMFPALEINQTLPEIISKMGLRQLRIAETEKYAHVTFFFNGGREEAFPGESRIMIPSPKVATYDLCPEMSAHLLTDKLVENINSKNFDFIVVNYANGDMVGHTGNLAATIKAVETIDACLEKLAQSVLDADGLLIITADHGNAESMQDPATGKANTAHTTNPVPLLLIGNKDRIKDIKLTNGRLCDISPTILELTNIEKPVTMSGKSLIIRKI